MGNAAAAPQRHQRQPLLLPAAAGPVSSSSGPRPPEAGEEEEEHKHSLPDSLWPEGDLQFRDPSSPTTPYRFERGGDAAGFDDERKWPAAAVQRSPPMAVWRRNPSGLAAGNPPEVLAMIFAFLEPEDVARAASVAYGWRQAAHGAHLWASLDLGSRSYRVSDLFLRGLLAQPQFSQLQRLRLDQCSGLTAAGLRALAQAPCGASLEELSMIACRGIRPALYEVFTDPRRFPNLKRLELYESVFPAEVADLLPAIREVRPGIDLGCLELIHAAATGREEGAEEPARCRHRPEERMGGDGGPAGGEWCFGPVSGRLVYTNQNTGGLGNIPEEVLFSCTNHMHADMTDPDLFLCEKCECMVRRPSAFSEVCCRVCRDHLLLVDKSNWIPLQGDEGRERIRGLRLSNVTDQTLELCDRQNLPKRLQTFGSTRFEIDYSMPPEDQGDAREAAFAPLRRPRWEQRDLRRVPLRVFTWSNGSRLDDALENLRGRLRAARKQGLNRALLCWSGTEQVEVLADRAVVVDGLRGLWSMEVAQAALEVSTELLWALLGLLVIVAVFAHYNSWNPRSWNGRSDYLQYMDMDEEPRIRITTVFYILLGFLLLMVMAVIAFRFWRERCISCLKRMYQLNIWVVYAGGLLVVMFWAGAEFGLPVDIGTAIVLFSNWGLLGVYSLFSRRCPPLAYCVCQVVLHATMALSVTITLGATLGMVLAALLVFADTMAWARGTEGWMGDELVMATIQDDFIPRILYLVGALRLRVAFFLAYAILAAASLSSLPSRVVTLLVIWSTFAVVTFLLPYLGRHKLQQVRAFVVSGLLVFLFRMVHGGFMSQVDLPRILLAANSAEFAS